MSERLNIVHELRVINKMFPFFFFRENAFTHTELAKFSYVGLIVVKDNKIPTKNPGFRFNHAILLFVEEPEDLQKTRPKFS